MVICQDLGQAFFDCMDSILYSKRVQLSTFFLFSFFWSRNHPPKASSTQNFYFLCEYEQHDYIMGYAEMYSTSRVRREVIYRSLVESMSMICVVDHGKRFPFVFLVSRHCLCRCARWFVSFRSRNMIIQCKIGRIAQTNFQ